MLGMWQTIMKVDNASVRSIGGGKYEVTAVGTVPTAGWTNPSITGAGIISNGILQYDFEAYPPSGHALQVLSQVKASSQFGGPGTSIAGLTTVRITAKENSIEIPFPPCG